MYDYFYGPQADQFNFIRIPAVLFSKEEFKGLSSEAKVLYGILLKRMDLSAKNGWFDDQGRVFIICTLEEIMETMNCADNKATKLMNELEEKCGLIERKRQGQGKCILQLRGVRPFLSDKYDLTQHPNFKYTADFDKKYTFDIEKYLNRRMKLKKDEVFDVVEA